MSSLIDLTPEGRRIPQHRPWPGAVIGAHLWRFAASGLAQGRWSLLGLWAEPATVQMAVMDEDAADIAVVSLECPDHTYPSVGLHHPPALRLERAVNDLFGLTAQGLPDTRPWLDHHRWGARFPLGNRIAAPSKAVPYRFLPAEGDGLHQIAVGPVHAGIIEPGHFRFTASGETVVRLEQRLGYTHKGIEGLMTGADLDRAVQLAGRVSGDSTIAYAYAFARAAEAALELTVPDRAVWLRALMAELERLANHLGDIGAICNDASFTLMHAHCSVLRESVLRASDSAFGHRLMRDIIVTGGVTRDLNGLPEGAPGTHAGHRREAREGIAIVEGFRGDVLVWIRLRDGRVERCHLRDPSWFQWPLLEAVIEDNIVADFPLCNKSFNCSYSGHDL